MLFITTPLIFDRYPGGMNSFQWYHPRHLRVGIFFGQNPVQYEGFLFDFNLFLPPSPTLLLEHTSTWKLTTYFLSPLPISQPGHTLINM